jgi:hypothetical protein
MVTEGTARKIGFVAIVLKENAVAKKDATILLEMFADDGRVERRVLDPQNGDRVVASSIIWADGTSKHDDPRDIRELNRRGNTKPMSRS